MFEDIFTMSPSSLLEVHPGMKPKLSTWKTHIRAKKTNNDILNSSKSLLSYLTMEVEALMKADVPVSTIVSGGLDSSLITALACLQTEGMHSFNISYEGDWPFDEKSFAREVANHSGTIHHQVTIDPYDFQKILPKVVKQLGQPNADPIALSTYSLFEAINHAGFKVALSGDGADEMFGGYDRYKHALSRVGDWVSHYIDSLGSMNQVGRQQIYSGDYLSYINEIGSTASLIEEKLRNESGKRLDTILTFERNFRLPNYHLRRVDHLSMANSVEVRVPFCQPRIVDFARQLTDEERISGDEVKRILYHAAEGLLPVSIMRRKKQPFTLPINAMMRPSLPLFKFIRDVLDHDTIRKHNIFDFNEVEQLLHKQATYPNDTTALALWSIMIFQLWIEQYNVSVGSHRSIQEGTLV